MGKPARLLLVIAVALVSAAAGLYFGAGRGARVDAAALAALAALQLPDAAGAQRSLSEWRGRPLVVNFWATWCPPCREEMPAFSRLQDKFGQHRVQFVGIALDEPDRVRDFAAAHPVSYPLLVSGFGLTKLMADLGNQKQALPFTLVLDASGGLATSRLGVFPETELENLLRGLAEKSR
ncbi:MAG: TlpA family protein disulfide reductase [Rhodocyclaceae bacterium]|nr:TlpA family protein disulfide reductase [Rhodocyclaceae bacterium]